MKEWIKFEELIFPGLTQGTLDLSQFCVVNPESFRTDLASLYLKDKEVFLSEFLGVGLCEFMFKRMKSSDFPIFSNLKSKKGIFSELYESFRLLREALGSQNAEIDELFKREKFSEELRWKEFYSLYRNYQKVMSEGNFVDFAVLLERALENPAPCLQFYDKRVLFHEFRHYPQLMLNFFRGIELDFMAILPPGENGRRCEEWIEDKNFKREEAPALDLSQSPNVKVELFDSNLDLNLKSLFSSERSQKRNLIISSNSRFDVEIKSHLSLLPSASAFKAVSMEDEKRGHFLVEKSWRVLKKFLQVVGSDFEIFSILDFVFEVSIASGLSPVEAKKKIELLRGELIEKGAGSARERIRILEANLSSPLKDWIPLFSTYRGLQFKALQFKELLLQALNLLASDVSLEPIFLSTEFFSVLSLDEEENKISVFEFSEKMELFLGSYFLKREVGGWKLEPGGKLFLMDAGELIPGMDFLKRLEAVEEIVFLDFSEKWPFLFQDEFYSRGEALFPSHYRKRLISLVHLPLKSDYRSAWGGVLTSLFKLKEKKLEFRVSRLDEEGNEVSPHPLLESYPLKKSERSISIPEKDAPYAEVHSSREEITSYFEKKNYFWSPSRLDLYLRCPRQFYYREVKGFEPPRFPEIEIDPRESGSFFHRVLETLFLEHFQELSKNPLDEALIENRVNSVCETHFRPGHFSALLSGSEYLEGFLRRSKEQLLSFFKMELSKVLEAPKRVPAFMEKDFSFKVTSTPSFEFEWLGDREVTPQEREAVLKNEAILIRGKIDRIDLSFNGGTAEEFEVIDYKSSDSSIPSKKDFQLAKSLQLPIYSLAAYLGLPVWGYSHHGLERVLASYSVIKSQKRTSFLKVDCNQPEDFFMSLSPFVEVLFSIQKEVLAGNFPLRPDKPTRCDACEFQNFCPGVMNEDE